MVLLNRKTQAIMDPITIISALASFAPALSKWMGAGSDVQSVADKASSIAQIVTGKPNLGDAVAALQADPTLAAKYQQSILDQQTAFEQMYVSDKASARAMQVSLAAQPGGNKRADWLSGIAVAVVVGILAAVIFYSNINEFAKGVLTTILGVFLQQLNNIYSFEFGTTRRSQTKTDLLDKVDAAVSNASSSSSGN